MIKQTKILVLDEATANVDMETDNLIQRMLKECFKECTVLIIAHRLATVMDSDAILVMDQGKGKEYDHPFKLLVKDNQDREITNEKGYLSKMVQATGKKTSMQLFNIARSTFNEKKT